MRRFAVLAAVLAAVLPLALPVDAAHAQRREAAVAPVSLALPAALAPLSAPDADATPRLDLGAAPGEVGASPEVVLLGSVLGGLAGATVGGMLGGGITSHGCEPGNPDACLGEAVPGFLVGAGAGMAAGAPLGAHLVNGRRGDLGRSLVVSSTLFGVQALTFALVGTRMDDGLERAALPLAFLAIPVAQVVGAAIVEERTERPRPYRPQGGAAGS